MPRELIGKWTMSMIELSSPHKNMDIMQPEGVKGVIQEDSSDVYAAVHNW